MSYFSVAYLSTSHVIKHLAFGTGMSVCHRVGKLGSQSPDD